MRLWHFHFGKSKAEAVSIDDECAILRHYSYTRLMIEVSLSTLPNAISSAPFKKL